jgi:hypothetical protein
MLSVYEYVPPVCLCVTLISNFETLHRFSRKSGIVAMATEMIGKSYFLISYYW